MAAADQLREPPVRPYRLQGADEGGGSHQARDRPSSPSTVTSGRAGRVDRNCRPPRSAGTAMGQGSRHAPIRIGAKSKPRKRGDLSSTLWESNMNLLKSPLSAIALGSIALAGPALAQDKPTVGIAMPTK